MKLEAAQLEIEGLKQLIEALENLNRNMVGEDASISDIQMLNHLFYTKEKTPQGNRTERRNSVADELPSIKLFKRMT